MTVINTHQEFNLKHPLGLKSWKIILKERSVIENHIYLK